MAEVGTYTCSNQKCRFLVRLSSRFPVWRPETARELRTLRVTPQTEGFVARYRSELFCRTCKAVTESTETNTCVVCESQSVAEEAGQTCPRCNVGVFSLTTLSVF